MRYRLLGQLEVVADDGREVALSGDKERVVLAALLLAANRVVSPSRLIDVVWGERQPQHGANALQVQVSRLRKKLEAASGRVGVLRSEPAGYRLAVLPGELDVERFEALVTRPDGPPYQVSARLGEALALWRGPVLAGVDSDALRGEAVRLAELRWSALERRIDADLRLGRHLMLVAELEPLVAEQPLREGFARQLMVALYRCGRQADALAVYRRTREVLAEELGIDPSPGLQALELAVLNQSVELNSAEPVATEVGGRPPRGTVTFLFTDIEGSTSRLRQVGAERAAREFMGHRAVIRDAVAAQEGFEVDTEGDGFFAVFSRASDALAAAAEIQKGLAGGPIQVRTGIHTGEPLVVDREYVGLDVHKAARICSAAHGGQVLVSQATREVADADLNDLGEFRLKDLSRPERLFQLGADEFPPPRALGAGNLPTQATALLGRQRELADLVGLTRYRRLVTLTGPGGSGKTRLALQVAAELADQYSDGAWWVALAAISDPALVAPAVAQALGVQGDLGRYLASRNLLILVDNLEQVLDAAPELGQLLAGAPGLTLLMTSRERLAIAGEQEYPVGALDQAAAAELFVTRARQVAPDFMPDDAVGEICSRLDRLPLALELAAPSVKLLTTAQILARLDRPFELLSTTRRDVHQRQTTMQATIDWSYDLLPAPERQAFRALGVFAGSFEVEAAERICSTSVAQLQSLVDKSLLRRTGDARLFLLETTREYALDRLRNAGELAETRRRHADWFFELAEASRSDLERHSRVRSWSMPSAVWARRLVADIDNFRAVLAWALQEDLARGLELAVTLHHTWLARGQNREIAAWFEQALAGSTTIDVDLRADAFYAWARATTRMGGHNQRAEELCLESLRLFRQAGNSTGEARAMGELGVLAYVKGDFRQALRLHERNLSIIRQLGEHHRIAYCLNTVANDLMALGELDRARPMLEEAIPILTDLEDTQGLAITLDTFGELLLAESEVEQATTIFRQSLGLFAELGDEYHQACCLADLAHAAALSNQPGVAGRLWTIATAAVERLGLPLERGHHDPDKTLGPLESDSAYRAGAEAGRTLSLADAVREQLDDSAPLI